MPFSLKQVQITSDSQRMGNVLAGDRGLKAIMEEHKPTFVPAMLIRVDRCNLGVIRVVGNEKKLPGRSANEQKSRFKLGHESEAMLDPVQAFLREHGRVWLASIIRRQKS